MHQNICPIIYIWIFSYRTIKKYISIIFRIHYFIKLYIYISLFVKLENLHVLIYYYYYENSYIYISNDYVKIFAI